LKQIVFRPGAEKQLPFRSHASCLQLAGIGCGMTSAVRLLA